MKKLLSAIILLVIFLLPEASAQKRKTERAYEAFEAGEYYEAIDLFKDAYSKTSKSDKSARAELVFMVAEAYRYVNDPRNSETWYKLAVKSSYSKPDAQFSLAESLKKKRKVYPGHR